MKLRVFGYLLFPLLTACTTMITLGDDQVQNKIYSGTRRQIQEPNIHTFQDFPFSLVADTVLLPVTIPWTIVNVHKEDEAQEGAQ